VGPEALEIDAEAPEIESEAPEIDAEAPKRDGPADPNADGERIPAGDREAHCATGRLRSSPPVSTDRETGQR